MRHASLDLFAPTFGRHRFDSQLPCHKTDHGQTIAHGCCTEDAIRASDTLSIAHQDRAWGRLAFCNGAAVTDHRRSATQRHGRIIGRMARQKRRGLCTVLCIDQFHELNRREIGQREDQQTGHVVRLCHLSIAALLVGVNPAMTALPPTGPMFMRAVGMPSFFARRSADFTSTPT